MTERTDDTDHLEGAKPATQDAAAAGVRGGDAAERMDGGNDSIGRGADGDTAAREELRVSLGERSPDAGSEST